MAEEFDRPKPETFAAVERLKAAEFVRERSSLGDYDLLLDALTDLIAHYPEHRETTLLLVPRGPRGVSLKDQWSRLFAPGKTGHASLAASRTVTT